MAIKTSDKWEPTNLAHRFTTSFFSSQYGDIPAFIVSSKERENQELNYFNIASPDIDTDATICAGLLVSYVESQGIPYHDGKDRKGCFDDLQPHLKVATGKVLYTADIVDHYFKFINEAEFNA